jgi:UDPglucose--hexose-1-phosphate uridylyltransferase
VERKAEPAGVAYDPNCYLCPGNTRAGGVRNPPYTTTFVFENDYAALRPETPDNAFNEAGLLIAEGEKGTCRVVCFSPNHSLTVARMQPAELRLVVDTWVDQYLDLASKPYITYVQIFENRGEMMGASNPHPHCQIWANERLPNEIALEQASQLEYARAQEKCLICNYLKVEAGAGERRVCENESFAVVVPFWAVWPFETMVISKRHVTGIDELTDGERNDLAEILKRVTTRYDNLFETSFPYTMGFHQRPTDDVSHPEWHLHAHFYPPLLRSATVRKFMVGYELLAMPQRDITAESAAERLRSMSEQHYLER